LRLLSAFQHRRTGFCHDRDVRRHLSGTMAQRGKPFQRDLRLGRIAALPDLVWRKSVHGTCDAGHSRRADFAEKTIREGSGLRMTLTQQLITIAMIVLGTALTRYLPFMLFPAGKQTPPYVRYLGKVLPSAVFGLLVIYCL